MRFKIQPRTLKAAVRRYDDSRVRRYGLDHGFDFTNPGHVSRVLGVSVESQISQNLFGTESGYVDPKASTDGGWDLEIDGVRWDVKANNVDNENSWLVQFDKKENETRPDDTHILCVNGVLGKDLPNNRTFEIVGWTTLGKMRNDLEPRFYKFGRYWKLTPESIQPFDDFQKLGFI